MRLAPVIAGALVVAAAAMAVVAFTGGDDDERAGTAPAEPTAVAASDGEAVWVEHGCGSCHTLAAANATGTIGPDLGSSLRGMPAAYVKESIVAPNKAAAPNYETGSMPDDYASRIPPDDLDRLVTFLLESAR